MNRENLLNELNNLEVDYNLIKNLSDAQINIKRLKDSKYEINIRTKNNNINLSKYKFSQNQDGSWNLITLSKIHSVGIIMAVDRLIKKKEKIKNRKNKNKILQKIEALIDEMTQRENAAEWDTKYINSLPDAAFAVIAPGGKKDSEGKTVPRTLRHLPHHTMNVKRSTENNTVDKPHLRNALARLPQTKISPALKSKAKAHLVAHARALKIGDY